MTTRKHTRAVVLHHTQGRREATVGQIRAFHMEDRGWADIGYHYLVRLGRVCAARPVALEGAHAYCKHVGKGRNHDTIGVAITGDLREGWPPEEDMVAVANLIRALRETWGPLEILSHGEVMAELGHPEHTDCPGSDWVEEIRRRVDGAADSRWVGGPEKEPLKPLDADMGEDMTDLPLDEETHERIEDDGPGGAGGPGAGPEGLPE